MVALVNKQSFLKVY